MSTCLTKVVQRLIGGITFLAAISTPVVAQPPVLVVSVAASVNDALEEIVRLYRAKTGVTVALNAGGSNTLARQIVAGARAGLFISADAVQMDVVERAGKVVPGTRITLLTNELVLVAPQSSKEVTLERVIAARINRLAMGEPTAVPAGVYGRKWLEHEGAWPRLEAKVVPFPTVRAVLSAVQNGRVDAGIVYRTDAMVSTGVRVIAALSQREHPYLDIAYPAAVIAGPTEGEARKFLDFLKGPDARAVLDRKGFGAPSR